jgi:hypothetical protein
MALKGWVVHKVNRLFTRVDLPPRPPRATPLGQVVLRRAGEKREPALHTNGSHDRMPRPQHLGAYAPLVAAMREELEHFVASHVRMHLAIAEHDRYLLTSIDVECIAGDESRELLQRFMREFKPRQIKAYLAKEVIGRLPNASAIDLAHFGGLNAAPGGSDGAEADDAYGELLAELRSTEPRAPQHPYQVSLKGRWSEQDAVPASAKDLAGGLAAPRTPLAGRTLDVEIDDAGGTRHVTLTSVFPGRRFAVGSGEGCDIVVTGKYVSRRHCEVWLDKGAWWVTDSGSTNGIRVESASSVLGRSGVNAGGAGGQTAIEVVTGARIVLSGLARGEPSQYPRLLLRTANELGTSATPMAPRVPAPTTPATPIVAPRARASGLMLTVRMASGERTIELPVESLPFAIGRSRSQALVIDWAHEDVSGHHADIVELDERSAQVVVRGDNGVTVAGVSHPSGTKFRWHVGEQMTLGHTQGKEPECTLTLSRRS